MPYFRTNIVHQRLFNSYKYDEYAEFGTRDDKNGAWEPGDFVLHLPAVSNARRIELFNEYLQKVIK